MEAKDTIVNDTTAIVYEHIRMGNAMDISHELEAQAEISFKAGYKQRDSEFVYNPDYLDYQKGVESGRIVGRLGGIREVVEFVEGNIPKTLSNYVGFWQSWQVQKEEWGL